MSDYPVVHFEMPYDDAERAQAFYRDAFGWGINRHGEEMGNYVELHSVPAEGGRPTEAGAINGGLYPRRPDGPVPGVVIGCADIGVAIERVRAAGGNVHGEPMHIPGIGRYATFTDTEGNAMTLLQPGD